MINIPILYEDADIAAINKPAGLMVHGDGRAEGPFLTDWVLEKFPETKGVGEATRDLKGNEIARPGIVHRLDRETSGVILIAKTQKGFEHLKKQFQDRTIKKKYLAFIWGDLKEEFGTITRPIGRNNGDFRKWSAQRGARGEMRDAETYWTRLGSFKAPGAANPNDVKVHVPQQTHIEPRMQTFTLVEAEPKTGRTHQIRVHFTAIQHPVVGDALYGPQFPMALGFTRTALHANSIDFENTAGKRIVVTAPLPEDFENAKRIAGI